MTAQKIQALATLAHRREETRGGHVRTDHPDRDDERWLVRQSVTRAVDGRLEVSERPVGQRAGVTS